jgi:hypothetical protein
MSHYNIMAEDNTDNIPPCHNKEGGLIKLFVKKVPFNYADEVLIILQKDGKKDWKVIDDFFFGFLQSC